MELMFQWLEKGSSYKSVKYVTQDQELQTEMKEFVTQGCNFEYIKVALVVTF